MKRDIHPKSNAVDARCVCGQTFPTFSTSKECVVAFCSSCHPFYTNEQKFADTEGRIDRFNKKYANFKTS